MYGAGLATGLSFFRAPACALAVVLLVLVCRVARDTLHLLAAILALGTASGIAARGRDARSCAAVMPGGRVRMELRLMEPVPAGRGRAHARPENVACHGGLQAWFRVDSAMPAGSVVRIEGTWERDAEGLGPARGILRVERATRIRPPRGPGDRLRNLIAARIGSLYGARAPLVDALVTGRRSDMDPALKRAFANSGLVHLLSISGFHIGVLNLWVVFLLRRLRVARVAALLGAAALGTCYVAFLGWPAPAVRAIALAWALGWLRFRQRAACPDPLLATTALIVLLLDPWAIVDLGAWLSVLSLWGAVRFARWAMQAGGTHWLAQGAASSLGATVATAPLTAAVLGAVAPVGIALNFVAIPLAALAVPGVLASLLAAPVPLAATALASGSGLALNALEALATWGAQAPLGHIVTEPTPRAALPWALLLAAFVWATPRQGQARLALDRLLVASTAAVWLTLAPAQVIPGPRAQGKLALHFLDVGQGDATVIRTPHGRFVVVDAGPRDAGFDAGLARVLPAVERAGGRRLDILFLSHAHLDHIGGARSILAQLPVGLVIEPALPTADTTYLALLSAIAASGAAWEPGRRGRHVSIDSVQFTLLHPDPTWPAWGLDLNEGSLVLLVEYGSFQAVLAGDAGLAAESLLAGRVGRVDLLKVGHHGSRTATGACWLAELAPSVAVVSAGRRNRYGHPAPGTLARLQQAGARIWRTDTEGAITVTTDGRRVEVHSRTRTSAFELDPLPIHQEMRGSCVPP